MVETCSICQIMPSDNLEDAIEDLKESLTKVNGFYTETEYNKIELGLVQALKDLGISCYTCQMVIGATHIAKNHGQQLEYEEYSSLIDHIIVLAQLGQRHKSRHLVFDVVKSKDSHDTRVVTMRIATAIIMNGDKPRKMTDHERWFIDVLNSFGEYSIGEIAYVVDRAKSTVHDYLLRSTYDPEDSSEIQVSRDVK